MKSKKTKSGSKKYGRNKIKCTKYASQKKLEKAKERKRERHLRKYPNDLQAR